MKPSSSKGGPGGLGFISKEAAKLEWRLAVPKASLHYSLPSSFWLIECIFACMLTIEPSQKIEFIFLNDKTAHSALLREREIVTYDENRIE